MILNLATNKYYIGSAKNLYKRWHTHKSTLNHNKHDNSYLQHAWNKYGELNFKFQILEYTYASNLLEREQYWIDKLCVNKEASYNLRKIANTNLGIKFSQEAKLKISNSKKGKTASEGAKLNMSLAQKNRPLISEETRAKLRISKLNQSEETKRKISITKMGVKRTEEVRAKLKIGWVKRKLKMSAKISNLSTQNS